MQEDAELLGVKLPEIEDQEAEHFEVFKSNIPVIEAFFILDGCAWQYSGMGELIGLDYKAADVIWSRAGVELNTLQFRDLMLFARTIVTEVKNKKGK